MISSAHLYLEPVIPKISQSDDQQKINMFNAARHNERLIFAFFCGFNLSISLLGV